MTPIRKPWSQAEMARLEQLVMAGASVTRCSAAFNRPSTSIRNQARRMGLPLIGTRAAKAAQKAKIAAAESTLPRGSWRNDGSRV